MTIDEYKKNIPTYDEWLDVLREEVKSGNGWTDEEVYKWLPKNDTTWKSKYERLRDKYERQLNNWREGSKYSPEHYYKSFMVTSPCDIAFTVYDEGFGSLFN